MSAGDRRVVVALALYDKRKAMSDCVRPSRSVLDLFVFSNNPPRRDLESNGAGLRAY